MPKLGKPMDNTSLQPSDGKKSNQIVKLTNRGRLFIEYMADGIKTVEAYHKAGYKGNAHAAYELKRLLSTHLRSLLESRGFSIEGVATELLALVEKPIVEKVYSAATGGLLAERPLQSVSLEQKLKILRLFLQALPKPDPKAGVSIRNVTAFVVNKATGSIDTTAEPGGQP